MNKKYTYEIVYTEPVIRGNSVRMIPRIEQVERRAVIIATDQTIKQEIESRVNVSRFKIVSIKKIGLA